MRSHVALTVAVALAALLLAAALDARPVAFEVGLPAVRLADDLQPGERTCRARIDAPADFDRIRLVTGTFGLPGPPLAIDVTDELSGRRLAAGRVAAGYHDNTTVEAPVGHVSARSGLRVCVGNAGETRVALFGTPPNTPPDHVDDPGARPLPALVFVRQPASSMLSLIPDAFQRAATFKARALGPWTFWILLGLMVFAVPAALIRALAAVSGR
jgi:hypothetical protein